MKAKPIVTAVLLLFVAVSVVALIAKEARNSPGPADTSASQLPEDGLVAFYFHGNVRCPTCRSIETQSHDAVIGQFADELADGRLVWLVVNYETPADAHFADEYQLVAPMVVLSQRRAGREAEWRSLDRVWELVSDPPAFAQYVEQEVQDMLASDGRDDAQLSFKTTQGGR
jgi:hypothetical protein